MPKKSSDPITIRVILVASLVFFVLFLLLLRMSGVFTNIFASIVDISLFGASSVMGYVVIQNIQKEDKRRTEFTRLIKTAEEEEKKKNEFINMAAHELRAPLTAVKGFLSMVIAGDAGPITDKTKEFLEDTAISAQRMIRLVNNMLNVARIEDGRMMYSLESFHLSEVAKQVRKEFEIEAFRKGLMLKLSIPARTNDVVYADRDRLEEVMVNFLSNAVKYTEEGMVEIKIFNSSPHVVRLEVNDTGPGVTSLEQKKLFQKFYRVEAKVGKTIGTGLGLYICKLLVEKFGGAIGVVSDEGKGSTFWFDLPIKSLQKKTTE